MSSVWQVNLQLNHELKHSITAAGVASEINMERIHLSSSFTINVRWWLLYTFIFRGWMSLCSTEQSEGLPCENMVNLSTWKATLFWFMCPSHRWIWSTRRLSSSWLSHHGRISFWGISECKTCPLYSILLRFKGGEDVFLRGLRRLGLTHFVWTFEKKTQTS